MQTPKPQGIHVVWPAKEAPGGLARARGLSNMDPLNDQV